MAYGDLYQRRHAPAPLLNFDHQPNGQSFVDHQRARNPQLRLDAKDTGSYTPQEREEARRIRFQMDQGQLPCGVLIPWRLQPLVFPGGGPGSLSASASDDPSTRLARAVSASFEAIDRAPKMSHRLRYILNGDEALSESDLDARMTHHGVRNVADRIALKIEARDYGVLLRPGERQRLPARAIQAAASAKKGRRVGDIHASDSRGCCAYDGTRIEFGPCTTRLRPR